MRKKGHWPAGKRRNHPRGWGRVRWRLERACLRQRISRREVARQVGVSDRTVRRWLAGEDVPAVERAAAVQRVLSELPA